jgi:hypothetical protein
MPRTAALAASCQSWTWVRMAPPTTTVSSTPERTTLPSAVKIMEMMWMMMM